MEIINQGIAWGWWPNQIWTTVSGLVLFLIIFIGGFSWQTGLIILGGLSNWFSRWQKGGVVDYWQLPNGLWFNLADILIIIGLGGLLWKKLWNRK